MPRLTDLFSLTALSRRHDVARTTLISAATTGRLKTWETGCGLMLSTDAEAMKYLQDDSEKRGRPRGATR